MAAALYRDHLHALWRAVTDNLPVLGDFHWSLVDTSRGAGLDAALWPLGAGCGLQMRIPAASVDLYAGDVPE